MQRQQIDVAQGESIRLGNIVVTLVCVDGDEVVLTIEDSDDSSWSDPVNLLDCDSPRSLASV